MKTKNPKILILSLLVSFILAPAAWSQIHITSDLALHYTPSSLVPSTIPPNLSNWNNTGTAPSGGNLSNSLSNPTILSNELNDFNVTRWASTRMRSGTVAAMNGDDVTGLTYMMVIRQTAIPTGTNVFASMQYSGLAGARTSPLRILNLADGNYFLDGANSTGGYFAGPSAAATLNEWQVLAATWDKAGNMSLYLDGVHAGTVAGGNLSIDGKSATFLELNVTSGGIGLDVAEVMVYSRALSAAEITQNTAYLNDVYAIPEPRFYGMVLGLAVIVVAFCRRRRRA